ncbi:MAG: hypothetical protein KGJ78_09125 [Alphaproteobacteria bacterium]|nr:hypothetical protein [Alphaproteobacteria bacterium]
MLAKIPYVDIRGYTPLELLFLQRSRARALVEAAASTFGGWSRVVSRYALPLGDRASRRWLKRTANPYLHEIDLIAEHVGVCGAFTLNICFEWGCTTGVWERPAAPLLRRVLDWPFPLLGESVVVAHQSGPAGDYLNVTWPGFCGVLQAMAPGRFAAALNQAPMRKRGGGLPGDWFLGRLAAGRATGLPASHLLRKTFETAPDYAAARRLLCEAPLATPAIFTLSGRLPHEGCVIERTEEGYGVQDMENAPVCAANHFETHLNTLRHGWRARPIDSEGRIAQARMMGAGGQGFSWFVPPIANVNSRLAMMADAAGLLAVIGTYGVKPVTEPFEWPG